MVKTSFRPTGFGPTVQLEIKALDGHKKRNPLEIPKT